MIKLRISDDELGKLTDGCWIGPDKVRAEIESAGIEVPAVTVEELAEVIGKGRDFTGPMAMWTDANIARAVLELMQRSTLPTASSSQWVDLARVTDLELGVAADGDIDPRGGASFRAWLIEECGGAR
jgi:hypothetical protein